MIEIKLERGTWVLDEADPLGPAGGFGEVFRGQGAEGEVAVKRLKITAASRPALEQSLKTQLAKPANATLAAAAQLVAR